MGAKRNFTKEQVLDAVEGSAGIMSTIASKLQCDWHTAEKYVQKWECTKKAFKDEREKIIDLAESKLVQAVNSGDGQMVRYVLSRLGKHRGYTEKQEVEIAGKRDAPVEVMDVTGTRERIAGRLASIAARAREAGDTERDT